MATDTAVVVVDSQQSPLEIPDYIGVGLDNDFDIKAKFVLARHKTEPGRIVLFLQNQTYPVVIESPEKEKMQVVSFFVPAHALKWVYSHKLYANLWFAVVGYDETMGIKDKTKQHLPWVIESCSHLLMNFETGNATSEYVWDPDNKLLRGIYITVDEDAMLAHMRKMKNEQKPMMHIG